MAVDVRPARPEELPTVATILDAAMLATDDLRARVAAGDVLVAVEDDRVAAAADRGFAEVDRGSAEADRESAGADRVLAALVLAPGAPQAPADGAHVAAVAVRRRRRGQGVGTALTEAAADRAGRLAAAFDADLRPFYRSLGFEIEPAGDGRLRGVRPPAD